MFRSLKEQLGSWMHHLNTSRTLLAGGWNGTKSSLLVAPPLAYISSRYCCLVRDYKD